MKRIWIPLLFLLPAASAPPARAFCGFYVAQADARLFNKASRVALARDGDRTVVTMSSDFKGDLKEFAVVIPVPTVITKEQVHIGETALLDHLDSFSAPRLVEYFDGDPCGVREERAMSAPAAGLMMMKSSAGAARDDALGVRIEARYTVGEYDILILSATQSSGLGTWLRREGYRLPAGAEEVLGSYIRQNMHFFVARVNLKEQSKLGFETLRPIQVAYESPKFMLPIRLGTVNAQGPQDLLVFVITKSGRVESTNYRNVKVPTGMDIPLYVKDGFGDFYHALFDRQVENASREAVFTEYAWPMSWCDPCAAPPLSIEELRGLGVFWVEDAATRGGPAPVFLTRLHVRYDREHFPEDLVFQETSDQQSFQARYVMRHPWKGSAEGCDGARSYYEQLRRRKGQEARALAGLTGWGMGEIRHRMSTGEDAVGANSAGGRRWYERIWKN